MSRIYNTPKISLGLFGNINVLSKTADEFKYLIGMNVNDIILFEDGTDKLLSDGVIILPRHYFIFVGEKDYQVQYKPYEFNQHRIVVATYKDIITNILSIG